MSTPVTRAPPLREPREVRSRAAADFQDPLAAVPAEVDQSRKVMELLEVVLIEVGEELAAARDVRGNLEIVDVGIPVVSDVRVRGHFASAQTCRRLRHERHDDHEDHNALCDRCALRGLCAGARAVASSERSL